MKLRWVVALMCVMFTVALVRAADEAKPADAAKPAAAADAPKAPKLTKPWNQLTSLTDDQKAKIQEVHAKVLADIKAIHEKETTDITAMLTDDQKKELAAVTEKAAAAKKTDAAAKTDAAVTPAPAAPMAEPAAGTAKP